MTNYADIETTDTGTVRGAGTSIDAALAMVPEHWRRHGTISWPGYDHGKLIGAARVELHHAFSSGGGPQVVAYGTTIAEAIQVAAQKALAFDENRPRPSDALSWRD